jgi:hypothetical protein
MRVGSLRAVDGWRFLMPPCVPAFSGIAHERFAIFMRFEEAGV